MLIKEHEEGYHAWSKQYEADYCRSTGLPMYSKKTFAEVSKKQLYTVTRAKREHVAIDDTIVYGWYRTMNGYVPLFRSKDVDELPLADVGKYARYAVAHGITENLLKVLESKIRKHCIQYMLTNQIDELIQLAISEKQHECYLLLVDYKYQHDLFRPKNFDLD